MNADCACEIISGPGGRNYTTATGERLVHEMAWLEDSRVDASVVLQDPELVFRTFWPCFLVEASWETVHQVHLQS